MNAFGRITPKLFPLPLILAGLLLLSYSVAAQEEDVLVNITARAGDNNSIPAILNYARNGNIHDATEKAPVEKKSTRVTSQKQAGKTDLPKNSPRGWQTRKDEKISQLQAQLEAITAAASLAVKKERALQAQITKLQASMDEVMADKQKIAAQLESLKSQAERDKESLLAKTNSVATLTAKVAELQKESTDKLAKLDLAKAPQQQAYSVGVSLGDDVLQELLTRENQGVKMDRTAVLKGIEDVFSDKVALDEQTRNKALLAATNTVYETLNKLEKQTINEGKKYLESFKNQKNVQFKGGVYSRIDYPGKGEIKPEDTVTVVMKETLTDGTVVSDMETAGKVWSQPLSAYPPVFNGPLSRLGNHGSITIVVPPELAYGSKGMPPKIPPGATMTYSVRIVDVEKAK